jgi:hypothetical protein
VGSCVVDRDDIALHRLTQQTFDVTQATHQCAQQLLISDPQADGRAQILDGATLN